jgi:hypothetical protein
VEQVTDEPAATVAGVTAVAVFTGAVEVIQTRYVRHGAGVPWREWEPGINRRWRRGWR